MPDQYQRDQSAHDDVLFQTSQVILLPMIAASWSAPGSFPGTRLLDERIGANDALVIPRRHVIELGGRLPSALFGRSRPAVLRSLVRRYELAVTGMRDSYTAQHLTNNHFNMFVVDLHALQSIDFLDLVDDVLGKRPHQTSEEYRGSAGPSTISSPLFTT